MRGLNHDTVKHVRVRPHGRTVDALCVRLCPETPVPWLRSADVVLLDEGAADTAEGLFTRLPGCSVVVVAGPSYRVHLRGGGAPQVYGAEADPWVLGALAHGCLALAAAFDEGTGTAGTEPVTARAHGAG